MTERHKGLGPVKLKHILYILLILFSIIPLYVFGIFMIYQNDRKVETLMRENLTLVSSAQISDIKTFCEARREHMEMVAQYDVVKDAVLASLGEKETTNSQEYVENLLIERKKYNNFIESISVIDREFHVVASSEEYRQHEVSQLKDGDQNGLTGAFYIGRVYERETEQGVKRVVPAYQGIYENDELIGYVVEEIAANYFDKYCSERKYWEKGYIYIMDGEGSLISYGGEETQLDKNCLTYDTDIEYTNWNIHIAIDLGVYKENTKAYRMLLLLTAAILTGVMAFISAVITQRLTNPIQQMEKTLWEIQKTQDYSLRLEYMRADEVGSLAENINKLLVYVEEVDNEKKEKQKDLVKKAECDPLTGVKNKKAIKKQIQDMVTAAIENKTKIAVGFLDIDDFRDFNTKYGHQEGDVVIQFVASALTEHIDGAVGRTGGDEFLFCMEDVKSQREVEKILEQLIDKLNSEYFCKTIGAQIPVPCSIGVMVDEGEEMTYGNLVQRADEAMYQAKEKGKNTYQLVFGESKKEG